MKRKGEGRERRAETPNCFALQEIITGASQVRVCPHGFGVLGLAVHILGLCAHNSSFVGSDWDIDWEEQRQSWGEPWSPNYPGAQGGDASSQQGHGEGERVEQVEDSLWP